MRVGVFSYPTTDEVNPALLFETEAISEALRSSGHDTSRLATPYAPKPSGLGRPPSPIDGRLGQTPHTSQSSPSSVEERDITESFRHYTLSTQDTGTTKYEIFCGIFVCKLERRKLSLNFSHCRDSKKLWDILLPFWERLFSLLRISRLIESFK